MSQFSRRSIVKLGVAAAAGGWVGLPRRVGAAQTEDRARGLDATEGLASPGEFVFNLSDRRQAAWMCESTAAETPLADTSHDEVIAQATTIVDAERSRRSAFPTPLERAADAYLVSRGKGYTIVAGYPWFTDWGRDTFIAIRGLCLATGRLADARDILLEWASAVSEGMLPNRFPDRGEQPEFNSVDASLWYVIAVHEFLRESADRSDLLSQPQRESIERAVLAIVSGYAAGTRCGIRMDGDGLLAAGVSGVQLTWMDAKVGQRVVTPRVGKPVEVQALWINALAAAARLDDRWTSVQRRATSAFGRRFWNPDTQCLFDVVDVDHVAGSTESGPRGRRPAVGRCGGRPRSAGR